MAVAPRDLQTHALASGQRDSGQAAVEAAIVLPLHVFLILGILQLGLMHQARLVTKYAAYKAARAGALNQARMDVMQREALAVLLPLVSKAKNGQRAEWIARVDGASRYLAKWRWPEVVENKMPEEPRLNFVAVTVCGPLRGDLPGGKAEVDFDDPGVASSADWRQSERTKLRVQVTLNYRMPIPLANYVIHRAALGMEFPTVLRNALRLGKPSGTSQAPPPQDKDYRTIYRELAAKRYVYVLPIRATYTLRMQSNLLADNLPETQTCVFPFHVVGK